MLLLIKQATLARLKPLRLATSHTYLYKKLEEFGKDFNKKICDSVTQQGKCMANAAQEQPHLPQNGPEDNGRKLVFDNLDYTQEVHWMTEAHQNVDCHYVTALSPENRVSGNELSDVPPAEGIINMENGKCLPSTLDNTRQRENYIKLVERIMVNNIPCLGFLSDVCTTHIQHKYSHEMSQKTDKVSNILMIIMNSYLFKFNNKLTLRLNSTVQRNSLSLYLYIQVALNLQASCKQDALAQKSFSFALKT